MSYRVAVVASHVIQYQDPFFRRLSAEPDIDLTVLFCSAEGAEVYRDVDMGTTLRWDLELLHGYDYKILRNFGRGDGFARLINPGLVVELIRGGYDLVIFMTGWAWLSAWIGFAVCRLARIPFFLFGDSSFIPPIDSPRAAIRAGIMRGLFGLTTGFLISGKWNADYYRHYRADPARFFDMPWAIDNERFFAASTFAPGEREALRAQHEIRADQVAILFSAKLIERKDPFTLLEAVARMRRRERVVVVFMGNGVLREPLEAFARSYDIDARFLGFVNQTDVPKRYAMCDVFVLPSLFDPRATVVNEAMACGLPVLITDRCGPAGDLVREGENGFVFAAGDAATLTARLDLLAGDDALREAMGRRSRELIADWNYERGVAGIKSALRWLETGARL